MAINYQVRRFFPLALLAACALAVAWVVSFGTLPKADFAFANGDQIQTVDPSKATGAPEGRIINALFEGLLRQLPLEQPPDATGNVPLKPATRGVADSYSVSEDGLVYTFSIRETATWSNGRRVTADDFVWSWRRTLHPETGSKYSYQLYYIRGAQAYNESRPEVDQAVEVELDDRPAHPSGQEQLFPRGSILRGILREVRNVADPAENGPAGNAETAATDASTADRPIYVVEIKPQKDGRVLWNQPGQRRVFSSRPGGSATSEGDRVERIRHLLPDFERTVRIRATDARTLVVTLNNRTPFFPDLVAFYPLYPVCRECIEEHGSPGWTLPQNIVTNGPYQLQFRRIRDRVRLRKSPRYWDAANVDLETIDAMAVKSETTSLNMFMNGQLDWATTVPNPVIPQLKKRTDFLSAPMLTVYFYRLNVARPPLDNARVREALNLAIDKRRIVEQVTSAGQQPARSFVPPGLRGYQSAFCGEYDPQRARTLLAEAGFPNGTGIPKIQIVYNTSEAHRDIAQVISEDWNVNLGVQTELRNLEWGTFLDTLSQGDYMVARSGWIGDYPDPNTFLDMFVTGGANNETNWSNTRYDDLIQTAQVETDAEVRMGVLQQAEQLLMQELPIIPIYFYVSINMVNPRIEGFSANIQDIHPLHILRRKK
ncbi:MAG: peptide-binding protein [Planctomycetaceae bacterium]|nr:peptide-binding protein [Planctomycetaceae bacterium]